MRDRRQEVDLTCENGFFVPPTHGVAMHTIPEIDEVTHEAREVCRDHQTLRAGTCDRPDTDRCRSRLMSLGERIPTSRPAPMIKGRPSLKPPGRPSGLGTGAA